MQAAENDRTSIPRLLVSVRDSHELRLAILGGADIVDLKEPANGALGCLLPEPLKLCLETHAGVPESPPLSLAMGELRDWTGDLNRRQCEVLSLVRGFQAGIQFLKFGLSECTNAQFIERWGRLANHLADLRHLAIPAIYADVESALGPEPEAIVGTGSGIGIRGILIDTFTKDGTGLLGCLDPQRLRLLRRATREQSLFLALAGQIERRRLPDVMDLEPDVIGVRGAVCEAGDRTAVLSQSLVASLRDQLRSRPQQVGLHSSG